MNNIDYSKIKRKKVYYSGSHLWVIKPVNLNQGRGVEVFRTLDELNDLLISYVKGYDPRKYKTSKNNEKQVKDEKKEIQENINLQNKDKDTNS